MIHIYDNDKQMIAVVHNFVSQEECEEILAHSWQNMERSTVASKDGKGGDSFPATMLDSLDSVPVSNDGKDDPFGDDKITATRDESSNGLVLDEPSEPEGCAIL